MSFTTKTAHKNIIAALLKVLKSTSDKPEEIQKILDRGVSSFLRKNKNSLYNEQGEPNVDGLIESVAHQLTREHELAFVATWIGMSDTITEALSDTFAKLSNPGPKRPNTAYIHFYKKYSKKIRQGSKETMTTGKVAQVVGEKWKSMTARNKAPYEKLADEDRKRYEAELAEYTKDTPPPPPKKVTPYMVFYGEHKDKVKSELGGDSRAVTRHIASLWKETKQDPERMTHYTQLASQASSVGVQG